MSASGASFGATTSTAISGITLIAMVLRDRRITRKSIRLSPNSTAQRSAIIRKPRPRDVHDLELDVVQLIDRHIDALLIAKDIEEIVVDGVAHLVLSDVVRPDIDDVMGLDDVMMLRAIDAARLLRPAVASRRTDEVRLHNAEKRLPIVVAP